MAITVSILPGGSNNHTESSANANAVATDFISAGVVGTTTNTSGVSPSTGAFAVNAQSTPNMTVRITQGVAYGQVTPTAGVSQVVRVYMDAFQDVAIATNASGFDWVYIKIDPTLAANPDVSATTVGTLVTTHSTSNSVDNSGSAPTYGVNIAVVASQTTSITNGVITDKRTQAGALAKQVVSNGVTPLAIGKPLTIHLRNTANQLITAATWTQISTNMVADVNTGFTYSSGNLTVPYTGYYRIDQYNSLISNIAIGDTLAGFSVNGAGTPNRPWARSNSATAIGTAYLGRTILLNANDVLRFSAYGGSGATINVNGGTDAQLDATWIDVTYVGSNT